MDSRQGWILPPLTFYNTKATDTPPMEPTIRCPDPETYDLAVRLFEKLRFETNLTDDEVDLVSLLDCLIQDERGRRHPTP